MSGPAPRDHRRASAGDPLERHYVWLLPAALSVMACLAWSHRFVSDDAFISFRYARNLVEGYGLVWNPGERVEGYTNFLWTLTMSVPFLLKVDPVTFCYALGPILSTVTLYCSSRVALLLVPSRTASLLAVILIGTNPTFASFATGGLETQLLACLQTALVWLLLSFGPTRPPDVVQGIGLSLLGAAALMTRLDSAMIVSVAFVTAVLDAWRRARSRVEMTRLLASALPALLVLGGWFCWKAVYYGDVLPNTFYAKTGASDVWQRGLNYLRLFAMSYLLLPVLVLIPLAFRRLWARSSRALSALTIMLLAHGVYVASIGGDFMEFRMMAPVLPLLFLLIVWSLFVYLRHPLLRVACVLLVLAGAAHHSRTFVFTEGIETVQGLMHHLYQPAQDWVGIGRELGETFRDSPDVRIAVTAAGAIPYYSRLSSLDMLGLNDVWVARHGIRILGQPGHSRVAPIAYMVARYVQLVLAHPWVSRPSPPARASYEIQELERFAFLADATAESLPPKASIVEIPLDRSRVLVALYLMPHPAIDALIRTGRWRRFPISTARE